MVSRGAVTLVVLLIDQLEQRNMDFDTFDDNTGQVGCTCKCGVVSLSEQPLGSERGESKLTNAHKKDR